MFTCTTADVSAGVRLPPLTYLHAQDVFREVAPIFERHYYICALYGSALKATRCRDVDLLVHAASQFASDWPVVDGSLMAIGFKREVASDYRGATANGYLYRRGDVLLDLRVTRPEMPWR